MNEPTPQAVHSDIATAATLLRRGLDDADQLGRCLTRADQALQEAQSETIRAVFTPERAPGERYLIRATGHLDTVRQRAGSGATIALHLQDNLAAAATSITAARHRLDALDRQPHPHPDTDVGLSLVRARAEELSRVIDTAVPLAATVHTHLADAARTASRLLTPDLREQHRGFTIFQVDRGVHTIAQSLARADESARHLDRTVENSLAVASRSLAQCEALTLHTPAHATTIAAPQGAPRIGPRR